MLEEDRLPCTMPWACRNAIADATSSATVIVMSGSTLPVLEVEWNFPISTAVCSRYTMIMVRKRTCKLWSMSNGPTSEHTACFWPRHCL